MKKYDYSLMAPGPVNLHPEVRRILSEPMIHHRTPEFDKILARVLKNLKLVFKTTEPVYILTSTGSGGMECLLVNTLSRGDSVLCIQSGKFGERWTQMAKTFALNVDLIEVPWGRAADINIVNQYLQRKNYRAVLSQACETSTGVLHPIKEMGILIKNYQDTLFLVDGITALGALPLPMDEWHIDALVGGSQKAFMLPTGLSFVSFSKKAQHFFGTSDLPKFYFDIKKEKKANDGGETFFSSNVSLIKALDFVLSDIEKRGLESLFLDNQRRADFVTYLMELLGLKSYAVAKSASVSAIEMPVNIDGQKVRSLLEQKFNITIMGGQDQAKGKIVRIGHMGYIQDQELIQLAEGLYSVLNELGHSLKYNNQDYLDFVTKWLNDSKNNKKQ